MRRLTAGIGLGCGLALLLFFYRSALFRGEQYSFRDAAHYYYPLYQKVQAEWGAGRLPLWDPSENGGMPLLGNPTAAVLYPGKLIYAALPYAWGARLYAVAHSALAFLGMLALMRSWGTSRAGSSVAALAYTFGGPVLFQYCNIIFLVGAAWVPWGLLAVDRWLRLGKLGALPALGFVLAMEVLGGDPEAAYLTGLCAGGYAIGLSRAGRDGPWRPSSWKWVPLVLLGVAAWVLLSLVAASYLPGFRPEPGEKAWGPFWRWFTSGKVPTFRSKLYDGPVPGLPWTSTASKVAAAGWGLAGLVLLLRWRRRGSAKVPLVPMLVGLTAAATLAGALSAAQMVPALEFTARSGRASDEGAHDMYPFSLEPYRILEGVWPGVYGRRFGDPVVWSDLLMPGLMHRVWVPSLYLGGSTLVLALASMGFRGGSPPRAWLTGIALVSLIGGLGEYASPILLARYSPAALRSTGFPEAARSAESLFKSLGPNDAKETNAVRLDGFLRDGDASPYHLMSELLPGFQQFRFPSKLLTFTALAFAGLAGLGWDRSIEGRRSRRVVWLASLGSGASLALLATSIVGRTRFVAWLASTKHTTLFGPLDAPAAVLDLQVALVHGGLVMAATGALVVLARRRADLAGALLVVMLSVDLALANHFLVKTAPQADFETSPKVLEVIAEAERLDPSPGPYRVHRMPIWNPISWARDASTDRTLDFVHWEHETLQPKYGLLHGLEYTYTLGVAELYDHSWFFSPFPRKVQPDAARLIGVQPGEPVVVYPRRGFDLWGSRYFILPALPRWLEADRGFASFLPQTRGLYPPTEILQGELTDPKVKRWMDTEDVQVIRNLDAFPRAWIVHQARFKPPINDLKRASRRETMEEILFSNDPFWRDPDRAYFDPKERAWLEVEDSQPLAAYLSNVGPLTGDSVKVAVEESNPQRVVLDADLARPGLVILAEVFYPGWKLTIDDQPAPIYRANRLMRGAAVPKGKHRLVYTYEPRSFQVGAAISLVGVVVLVASTAWSLRRRPSTVA